jgi:chemotaxis protein histidine kinase CheA/ActR/RegA family two-component response regulator
MAKSFKTAKTTKLFIDECREYLTSLNQDFVKVEDGNVDEELIKQIDRNVHTIKGSSAMLEFMEISGIANNIEDVMVALKKNFPQVDKDLLSEIFSKVDEINLIVKSIEDGTYEEGKRAAPPPAPGANVEPPVVKPKAEQPASVPPPEPPAPETAPQPQKSGKPTSAGKPGRVNLFEIHGRDILPALDRCFSIFNEVESKFILADENSGNKEFMAKMFESVAYLHRSLICFGESVINEILANLIFMKDAVDRERISTGFDAVETIFKGITYVRAIVESATSGAETRPRLETGPLIKGIEKTFERLNGEKDYVSAETGAEIFDRLNIEAAVAGFCTPFEKKLISKSQIDTKYILHIKMRFKPNELGDLTSMSEFFKPLSEDGNLLVCLIMADGDADGVTGYEFHLFYGTENSIEEFEKKYSYVKKTGAAEITEVAVQMEQVGGEPRVAAPDSAPAAVAPAPPEEIASPAMVKPREAAPAAKAKQAKSVPVSAGATVRVDTSKLDVLVNLIAELVINHNKMEQEVKGMKQALNLLGDIFDAVKIGKKASEFVDREMSLEELLQPFRVLQPDGFQDGDQKLDLGGLSHLKEIRVIRENLVQLFDMELEKGRIIDETVVKIGSLKSEMDALYQEFLNDGLNIGRVIEELQEETMKLRMLPISGVLSKFPRRVRDIAKELGKKIDFIIEGEDTELDKTLIEELEDPLLHIIRNAVDHGIETTDVRQRNGKRETGSIRVTAYHEGNSVVVEVTDDGKGIDPAALRKACVEKRLISEEEAAQMDDKEALRLIFIPGFSTAKKVSDLSGRGVGMDVVKNSISKLKGTVDVRSEVGKNTTMRLKLPLTLAIIQAMIVKCSGQKFVIPMDPIESTELLRGFDVSSVEGREVFRFHDLVVPLIHLRDVYELPEDGRPNVGGFPVVVVGLGEKKIGIAVDEVIEKQQVVIKSLGDFLGDVKHLSGATIFGDGSMALILDVAGVIQSVQYISKRMDRKVTDKNKAKEKLILLVDDSLSGRIAQREMLERMGYSVDVASSGMQALTKLAERKFDMIVTDINMPRMDGYEFTQKVRSMAGTRRIPIVMVTSDVKNADRQKAFEVGIDDFLAKPFSEDDLRTAIEKHMRAY